MYYKCKSVSDPTGKKDAKMLKLHETWPVTSDEDLPEIKQHLEYFNNGRDYILSIKPQVLCEVNDAKNNLVETLVESQNYLKNLQEIIPKSEIKFKLNVIESHIATALSLSQSTSFTVSTTDITFTDVPPPVVTSSRGAPPTRKRRYSSETQEDDSEVGTALGENQCSCGEFFEDRNALDVHIKAIHIPSNWSCHHSNCLKFGHPYPNCYSLWKHIRTHHLKTYNFHCKDHDFRCEESGHWKNHLDEYHGITLDLRCPNKRPCNNKIFGTKSKLAAHIEICGKKQNHLLIKSAERHFGQTDIPRNMLNSTKIEVLMKKR